MSNLNALLKQLLAGASALAAIGWLQAQPPTTLSPLLPPVAACAMDWGDWDNDGDPDLVAFGDSADQPWGRLLRNDQTTFTLLVTALPRLVQAAVDWGDADGDGDLDLLLIGLSPAGAVSQLWLNGGAGGFSLSGAALPPLSAGTADWADLDRDGDLDIVLSGDAPGQGKALHILRNNGGGAFGNMTDPRLEGVLLGDLAIGDYDGDTLPDLFSSGFGADGRPATRLYRNEGSLRFAPVQHSFPDLEGGSAELCDLESDGDLDLLLTGADHRLRAAAYRKAGTGWAPTALGVPGSGYGVARSADFNGDGLRDILLCTENASGRSSTVYRQVPGGVFVDHQPGFPLISLMQPRAAWTDYNTDGHLDLVVTGYDASGGPTFCLYTFQTTTNSFRP
jgi:hypothetical protein